MRNGIFRLISALLSLAFLLSAFLSTGLLAAADETLVFSQDFESGSTSALGTADGNDADGYYAVGSVNVIEGGANGSAYCLKVSDADNGNGQWLNDLAPETDYVMSFSAKIGGWGGSAYPNVGVNGYDGSQYRAIDTFTEEWASYTITFTTGAEGTSACIYTWIFGSGKVDLYLDNVSVSKASHTHTYTSEVTKPATCGEAGIMTYTCACGYTYTEVIPATGEHSFVNGVCTVCGAKETQGFGLGLWDFEHNNLSLLGTPDGNDADGYYAVGNVSIVPGGAEGSAYCLKVSGADCGNGLWIGGLEPDSGYSISFYAKIGGWGGSAYPNVGVNGYNGDAYQAVDTFTESWGKYSVSFRTGKETTSACFYTWIFGSGAVDLYLDNVAIEKVDHVHSYTAVVTSPATCGTPGLMTYTCDCGDTYTEAIPPTGEHTFENGVCTQCGLLEANNFGLEMWNFEYNDISVLGTPDGNDADGYYAVGDVSIVPGGAEGSNYCLKIGAAENGNGQWINHLKPNTQYTLVFWAKAAGLGGNAFPNFGVNGYNGDAYQAIDSFTGNWNKYVIVFKTGATNTAACIYSWIFGSGSTALYIDNVTLTEGVTDTPTPPPAKQDNTPASPAAVTKTSLDGWDFESNDISTLGTADGNDTDGYYAVGSVSIVPGGADETQYCLKVSGAEHGNGQWVVGLKPDTDYTVVFWAKIDNWGGEAFPNFGVNGFDGGKYVAQDSFTTSWSKYTLTFRTGSDSTMACIYTWIFGSGAVDFYVDQVELIEGKETAPEPTTEPVVPDVPREAGLPAMKNSAGQSYVFSESADTKLSKAVLPLTIAGGVLFAGLAAEAVLLLRKKKAQKRGR